MLDVHSHLLPGIDDGCATLEESLACARQLVAAGYSEAFCTPHVWHNLPHNTPGNIRRWTQSLQQALDHAGIALRLHPGGEMNLQSIAQHPAANQLVTYSLAGRYLLLDLWADTLPDFFVPEIRKLQERGLT